MAKTESLSKLQKGDMAPAFELPGIDGRTYGLEDFRGNAGLLVLFMCNHCPYVKARIGEAVALHEEFGLPGQGDRIAFVAINPSDPEYPGEGTEASAEFARERGITFPYLYDEDGSVAKAYGATCTPDPFLFEASTGSASTLSGVERVDKDFRLVFHGRLVDALEPQEPVTERTMREAIQNLLAGKVIEPWFNPSLGCSIKFKGE